MHIDIPTTHRGWLWGQTKRVDHFLYQLDLVAVWILDNPGDICLGFPSSGRKCMESPIWIVFELLAEDWQSIILCHSLFKRCGADGQIMHLYLLCHICVSKLLEAMYPKRPVMVNWTASIYMHMLSMYAS